MSVRVLQSDSIQLTATKLTRIDPVLDSGPTTAAAWRRSVTSIQEIVEDPEFQPQFNEVDTIGVLVKVAKVEPGKNSQVLRQALLIFRYISCVKDENVPGGLLV